MQMHGGTGFIFLVLVSAFVVGGAIFSAIAKNRRQTELAALAFQLGFHFRPGNDPGFATGWSFLTKLAQGSDRYAFNVMEGNYDEQRVFVFDYHYQTGSGKNTEHHYLTFFLLILPGAFPELTIGRENLLMKIAETFGYNDIKFESAEFSKAFCVRSQDKKFAYDVCNPQMIELLLANRDLEIEIQGPALLLEFKKQLPAGQIKSNLQQLVEIRSRLPEYLFTNA
jgi:hypothetical protein